MKKIKLMMKSSILMLIFLAVFCLNVNAQSTVVSLVEQVKDTCGSEDDNRCVDSVTVLAAATRTGAVGLVKSYQFIELMVNSNENGDVTIQQSFEQGCDKTGFAGNWDLSSDFTYTQNGTFGKGYQVLVMGSKCVRWTFKNTGASTTTTFRAWFAFKSDK